MKLENAGKMQPDEGGSRTGNWPPLFLTVMAPSNRKQGAGNRETGRRPGK